MSIEKALLAFAKNLIGEILGFAVEEEKDASFTFFCEDEIDKAILVDPHYVAYNLDKAFNKQSKYKVFVLEDEEQVLKFLKKQETKDLIVFFDGLASATSQNFDNCVFWVDTSELPEQYLIQLERGIIPIWRSILAPLP